MLTVGTEWLIEAAGCDARRLRDVEALRAVFARAVAELGLCVVGEQLWHKFPGEGGVTGLAMLTESHLACHTYPEFGTATFNLYCCRERPAWGWAERLGEMLGAREVRVRRVRRTAPPTASAFESSSRAFASTSTSESPSATPPAFESAPTLKGSPATVESSQAFESSAQLKRRGGDG
jgi:S-adenosylmethionine decarboxylase